MSNVDGNHPATVVATIDVAYSPGSIPISLNSKLSTNPLFILTSVEDDNSIPITSFSTSCTTYVPTYSTSLLCDKDVDRYSYGFNGKQKDNERVGIGNHVDYGARRYDTRIGRPPTVDPLTKHYPWLSPYQFFSDNPIQNIDIDGMEGAAVTGSGINWSYFYSSLGIRGNDAVASKDYTKNVIIPAAKQIAMQAAIFVGTAVAGEVLEPLLFAEEAAPVVDATYVQRPVYAPEPVVETSGSTQVKTPTASRVKPADYSSVPDPASAGPGKKFTPAQKKAYIQENMKQNGGVVKSDQSGKTLDIAKQSRKGVKANMNQAEVDHIVPRSKGGKNTSDNAQILSKEENIKKSDQ